MAGHLQYRGKDRNGRHCVRWRFRSPLDQDKFVSRTFHDRSKREAEAQARAWGAEQAKLMRADAWQDPAGAQRLFSAVAGEWRREWGHLEPRTKAGYDHLLRRHIEPRFGRAKIGTVRVGPIEAWLNELAETRSRNTVRRIYTVLRGVMTFAARQGYIVKNPCADVQLPKPRRNAVRGRRQLFLTAEEVASVANAIDPHWRVPVYVASWCGLRAGELWGLRVRDVDLDAGTITVEQALKETNGAPDGAEWIDPDERGLYIGAPKSDASCRTLTMPAPIRAMLAEHLAGPLPGGNGPDDLVFTTPSGTPVRQSLFYARQFKPAVRRVFPEGHPKRALRWHDLRHTCASLSLAVTPNLHVVKERLGHSDIRVTINTYGHMLPDVDRALADGLTDLFNAAEQKAVVIPLRAVVG